MKIGPLTGGCTHAIASSGGMLNDHRGVVVAFLVSHLERNAVHYGARCLLRSIITAEFVTACRQRTWQSSSWTLLKAIDAHVKVSPISLWTTRPLTRLTNKPGSSADPSSCPLYASADRQ
jgi:hypothetical protein